MSNPWDPFEKVRETMEGRICGKGKFWVWSGTEMEWCNMKVVVAMMVMMNQWQKGEMTVTRPHHRQFDKSSREEVKRAETAAVDFQRGVRRWTSRGDDIRVLRNGRREIRSCFGSTPWTIKKRGTLFLTITTTFLGQFLHFLQQMKQE